MKGKEINVSQAREKLPALLGEVQRTGRPVVILRRGAPQAVLLSYEQYRQQFPSEGESTWKLCGSMRANPDVDIDDAISEVRATVNESLKDRIRKIGSDLKS